MTESKLICAYRTKGSFDAYGLEEYGMVLIRYDDHSVRPYRVVTTEHCGLETIGHNSTFRGLGHALRAFNNIKAHLRNKYK